jgi:hypothetical protein
MASRGSISVFLALAKQFRGEAAAWREVERLGLGRRSEDGPRNLKELVDHWLEKECSMDDSPESRRAFSTKDTYRGYLRKWCPAGANALRDG